MRQISGNKLLVKALKRRSVDTYLDIPVHAPLISATNYTDRVGSTSSFPAMNRHLSMRQMPMQELPEKSVYAL